MELLLNLLMSILLVIILAMVAFIMLGSLAGLSYLVFTLLQEQWKEIRGKRAGR